MSKALSAYRNALRATSVAFKGDVPTLTSSRLKIKTEMKLLKSTENPNLSIDQRIDLLNQVSTFLKRNIVQGVKEEQDTKYLLNIHKETELGDNESIKTKKRKSTLGGDLTGAPFQGGCCGGGNVSLKQKTA